MAPSLVGRAAQKQSAPARREQPVPSRKSSDTKSSKVSAPPGNGRGASVQAEKAARSSERVAAAKAVKKPAVGKLENREKSPAPVSAQMIPLHRAPVEPVAPLTDSPGWGGFSEQLKGIGEWIANGFRHAANNEHLGNPEQAATTDVSGPQVFRESDVPYWRANEEDNEWWKKWRNTYRSHPQDTFRQVQVQPHSQPTLRPDFSESIFGKTFTDHMLQIDYDDSGYSSGPKIGPFGDLHLDPSTTGIHYGAEILEGMKAFQQPNGAVSIFRLADHIERMVKGAEGTGMTPPPREDLLNGLLSLTSMDRQWVPNRPGALYIRPALLGTDPMSFIGTPHQYKLFGILTPVTNSHSSAPTPLNMRVERKYVRAFPGGVGQFKASGNYFNTIRAAEEAKKQGYDGNIWLRNGKYLDEVGTMNLFVVYPEKVVTPRLSDTILPGITRDSVIKLSRDNGIKVEEGDISVDGLLDAHARGELREMFGTGTLASVVPIGGLGVDGEKIVINDKKEGPLSHASRERLWAIQYGTAPDEYGWMTPVPPKPRDFG